jgi:ribosomal protein S12 methylthiotransferase accessory factor
MSAASSPAEVARARQLVAALVGRRSGIVREVVEVPRLAPDEPPLFHVGGRLANPQPELGDREGLSLGGSGSTLAQALIAAICEGVERYCGGSFDRGALRLARTDELSGEVVAPRRFAAFSESQYSTPGFPYPRPSPEARWRWCAGVDLESGEEVRAPAAAVHMPYVPTGDEPLLCPSTSTGLCCGDSFEAAALGALCEVIERDALALTWLGQATPPSIPREGLERLCPLARRDDIRAYELTSDLGVPVFMIVGRGLTSEGRLLYTGSACHPDRDLALGKALREAMQGRVYVRYLTRLPAPTEPTSPADFSQHAQFYTRRPDLIAQAFAFLDAPGNESNAPPSAFSLQPSASLRELCRHLSERGVRPRIFDLSHPWCRDLGLSVVRAVMPELLGLQGHHGLPMQGHPRLARVAEALPLARIRCQRDEISPWPHPFA